MENKAMLEVLQSRGYAVKSVSSTIDNITAESLIEELKPKDAPVKEEASATLDTPAPEKPKGPVLPKGAIVRSAETIEKEKQAAKDAAAAPAQVASPAAKAPAPAAPAAPISPERVMLPVPALWLISRLVRAVAPIFPVIITLPVPDKISRF